MARIPLEAFQAAGLYDPGAPTAADRLALLEWLAEQGFTVEDMRRALRESRLTGLAGDVRLRPGPRLSLRELAAQVGLAVERIGDMRLAMGLPPVDSDAPLFTADDGAGFLAFEGSVQLFGQEQARHFVRALGASLGRIAEAAIGTFFVALEGPILTTGGSELALAQANVRAMEALRGLPHALVSMLRAHMENAIRRSREAHLRGSSGILHLTVGFVDVVGFTPLSRQLTPAELGAVVDRFEEVTNDVVTAHDGRVVKSIGDAVMFVAVEARAACEIALTLVDRFAGDADVTPRGLATGALVMRGGDYYGPTVNLAARIADLAVPGEVLVNAEVAAGSRDPAVVFTPAGKRMLKGFDRPVALLSVDRVRGA